MRGGGGGGGAEGRGIGHKGWGAAAHYAHGVLGN